ncbi:palmitoyltransferase ZDHHC15 isoform X6 [Calonectris borealis]|uniref:palmitoyltransferase ZDHHC15 isoform X6 n=1 Tax=Calonectris borealis TaxID=1323832 RepID=UPI003F4B1D79
MALSRGLRCCQRAFAWLPVLIIALVVLWSYYAYVCELCLVTLSNPVEKGVRFCDRCQLIKPDRCHHCSVCAICVLKMDHHCPWVNNCIGFSNYKFFLLFLAYSLLYCLYIAATVFKYFIKYWTGELTNGRSKFHVLFLLFVAVMFFVSLMFLFGYHCWLVSRNRSTLEAFSAPVFQNGPDKNGFNLGFVKNLQQVFGEEKKLWLLPIASSQGDGHFFPMRALCEAQNPLLANEEQWEDDGIDEEPHGKGEEYCGEPFVLFLSQRLKTLASKFMVI